MRKSFCEKNDSNPVLEILRKCANKLNFCLGCHSPLKRCISVILLLTFFFLLLLSFSNQSHAGKVVMRHWFERNKHIFPASRWEPYDPEKKWDKYTVSSQAYPTWLWSKLIIKMALFPWFKFPSWINSVLQ